MPGRGRVWRALWGNAGLAETTTVETADRHALARCHADAGDASGPARHGLAVFDRRRFVITTS